MNSPDLIDRLIAMADGDLGQVHEALCECSPAGDGVGANLADVISYIISISVPRRHQTTQSSS